VVLRVYNQQLHSSSHNALKIIAKGETGPVEHVMREGTEKKNMQGTRKKPYTSPTLTKHGDVEEITEVLRSSGVKSEVSGDF
jgi:hypothetical protein